MWIRKLKMCASIDFNVGFNQRMTQLKHQIKSAITHKNVRVLMSWLLSLNDEAIKSKLLLSWWLNDSKAILNSNTVPNTKWWVVKLACGDNLTLLISQKCVVYFFLNAISFSHLNCHRNGWKHVCFSRSNKS